ncbi:MAG: ATP-binding cassette domain-containing protein [Lachnospiraceae bacterium]|nr:ATP-binding cassette domain-containing protein [Lachnospiraceae bacterium]
MTIYLENICKSYNGTEVLKDVNVSIEDGKCYAFTGPEGSGKSTLLKIFMGSVKPDSGKVSRMGDYKYPTLMTAYVPQQESLNLKKNAIWNVKKAHRTASKGRAAEELLKFFDEQQISCPVGELDPGKRRLVGIIRAMFVPADFIVLDEPFYGMSDKERERALEYVMNKKGTRPLLLAQREDPGLKDFKMIRL